MPPRLPMLALGLLMALAAPSRAGILGDDFNQEEKEDYAGLSAFRLAGDFGVSKWLISSDSTLTSAGEDFYEDTELGWNFSGDAIYYFTPRGGLGLTAIWFFSRASVRNVTFYPEDGPVDMRERIHFTYIGPSLWTRIHAGRYGMAHAGFGAGYFKVLDAWNYNGEPGRVEAETFAIVTSLGWDYSVARHLGVGLNGRFFFSNIAEYTYNGEKVVIEDVENKYTAYNMPMYRFELNVGLRFFL